MPSRVIGPPVGIVTPRSCVKKRLAPSVPVSVDDRFTVPPSVKEKPLHASGLSKLRSPLTANVTGAALVNNMVVAASPFELLRIRLAEEEKTPPPHAILSALIVDEPDSTETAEFQFICFVAAKLRLAVPNAVTLAVKLKVSVTTDRVPPAATV